MLEAALWALRVPGIVDLLHTRLEAEELGLGIVRRRCLRLSGARHKEALRRRGLVLLLCGTEEGVGIRRLSTKQWVGVRRLAKQTATGLLEDISTSPE